VLVHSLELISPSTVIDQESTFSIEQAFIRNSRLDKKAISQPSIDTDFEFDLQVIIPSVAVQEGSILFQNVFDQSSGNKNMQVSNISMQLFFEFTNTQRFVDIDELQFDVPEMDIEDLRAFGQIYNDERFFEVNAFTVQYQNSSLRFSTEINNLDILKGNIRDQLKESEFSYLIDKINLSSELLSSYLNVFPMEISSKVQGRIEGSGNTDSLNFSRAEIIVGQSFIRFDGSIYDYQNAPDLKYKLFVPQISVAEGEMEALPEEFTNALKQAISETNFEGQFSGNLDQTNIVLDANHYQRGELSVSGGLSWKDQIGIDLDFKTESLNIDQLVDPRIGATDLTLEGSLKSNTLDFKKSTGGITIQSAPGTFDNRTFEQLSILAAWDNGFIKPDIRINFNESLVSASGTIDLRKEQPIYDIRGRADNIDLKQITQWAQLKPVIADVEYDFNITGRNLKDIHGQFSIDVLEAAFDEDTLGRHQFYIDFNAPQSPEREIRLTSTAFDANLKGNFTPQALFELGNIWKGYFVQRYYEEIALDQNTVIQQDTLRPGPNQDLSIAVNLKNLKLINTYLPQFPTLGSAGRLNSSMNVNKRRLLFNASFTDIKTSINEFEADSLNIQATATSIDHTLLNTKDIQLTANLNQDAFDFRLSGNQLAEEASILLALTGSLKEKELTLSFDEFGLKSDAYDWNKQGTPIIRYFDRERLALDDFTFESDSQFVQVDGTFSSLPQDSVNYKIQGLDLSKISRILDIRLDFAGEINGEFTTTTLTTVPTIRGNIDIEELYLDNNLYGDLSINSQYNSDLNRFDTKIISSTDSAKYPEYYDNTGNKGQFFEINGYVLAPKNGQFPDTDTLYAFESDFKNIDLWVLPLIGPKVFAEGGGLANAKGAIWGNMNTYDYNIDISIGQQDAAFIRPQFLETDYYAQGNITWNRDRGFTFHDIYLIDPSGGNAILSGFYDVNDFVRTDSMLINLDMNQFKFLNNSFAPTIAFFGEAYASGLVTISGSNLAPVISTQDPLRITDFSEISIPLLEETEFDEDNRFIRFVSSFDDAGVLNSTGRYASNGQESTSQAEEQEDLSFAERFTLDLQFVAENPMNVRLIFDPVTGDIITAQGTGRLRILLEDEEVSMFGRFDVNGGRYQFVSGDIFTRRFEIEPGGTIVWEGDPANARLDVNAIYSARPDINTLSGTGTRDPENAQRVPVELVLNIGGTISSIENNFFFRLPDTFETQQNSTLSTQLASINRDENLKLLQATNFMLMGNFIPVSSAGDTQANLLGENISGSAAVLNPLLSSQVINPLLSNQVNSLLNSDLSSLDVDFNLNTYNQVDLGVALRLYNDKLILRREGQITGRQSNIGDLGATYRINQTFAVTAFHRQDLTFGNISSTEQSQQSQEINGVGLEAKVSFNTWNEFFKRLFAPFRKLFGINEEQNQEEITENRQAIDPA
jgi:hypothetical protein